MDIKYRIWDKKKKSYVSQISHKDSRDYSLSLDPWGGLTAYDQYGEEIDIDQDENYIIEQYTGLADKNKSMIFEGDIIKFGDSFNHYEAVVTFKAPSFIAKVIYSKHRVESANSDEWYVEWEKRGQVAFTSNFYMRNAALPGWNMDIIGNINQNPNLLEPESYEKEIHNPE
jgi:uncharacterized phage protein (TIGR01671 family)